MRFEDYSDAVAYFSGRITDSLQSLLQEKHLYQNIAIETDDFVQAIKSMAGGRPSLIAKAISSPWEPEARVRAMTSALFFKSPDVKIYCNTCDRVEAFNHVETIELGNSSRNGIVQIFALSFLCQSCKVVPEAFLVRREGFKLILCGRAPIEHVSVPNDIPQSVRKYYSGAIVAHQSGQTLAGIFLLRCFIEQWAKIATSKTEPIADKTMEPKKELPADKTIDLYMETLPDDFKARFPSLRDYYGKLSADIHNANGSVKLFDETCEIVKEHFTARRLFKVQFPAVDI